jgi:uncharacterized protein
MELVTDLARISRLAKERAGENWNFRWLLKHPGRTSREIDGIVRRLWVEVRGQVACTDCANCCRLLRPYLSPRDVRRLSRHLRMDRSAFEARFLRPLEEGDEDGRPFEARPCPFLSGGRCTVYPARPAACRSYPNLHQRGFLHRASQAFTNCAVCPIVFNVYEGLKRKLAGEGTGAGNNTQ